MTATTPPPKSGEVPLEDIDRLLEAEDPEFTKQLQEVRAVEIDKSIEIESSVMSDDNLSDEVEVGQEKGLKKFKTRIRTAIFSARMRMKARLATARKDLIVFLRTRPKEFALYSFSVAKIVFKKSTVPLIAFFQASLLQKLSALALLAILGAAGWVLLSNFKGVWLPGLNEPILRGFEPYAEFIEEYDLKDGGASFYTAFPQERHEFLFRKMKVNLKRGAENPNPMGAFEVIVLLDSKDTAIEVRDREVEFFDMLQRVFEDETFNDLETEIGKARLKGRIKRDLNQKLTQGWIKDVSFKNFILKP